MESYHANLFVYAVLIVSAIVLASLHWAIVRSNREGPDADPKKKNDSSE